MSGQRRSPDRRSAPLVVGLTVVTLTLALTPHEGSGLWTGTAVAAAVGLWGALVSTGAELRARLRPTRRSLGQGLLGGAAMAALTHAAYPALAARWPSIGEQAVALYARLDGPPGRVAALPIVLLIVLAEELVFRGVAYGYLERRAGTAWAVAGATFVYALPQLGSGSWLLPLLALGCGLVWTLQRARTGSLLVPLATHLTWDLVVMVAVPLVP